MQPAFLRSAFIVGVVVVAVTSAHAAEPPAPSPEQKALDHFLGSWRTTYKAPKAEWTPEERTGSATLRFRRTLGGQFVQEDNDHADKTTGMALYTYDAQQKSYRAWWFSSTGQGGDSTGKWDEATKTFTWTSTYMKPFIGTSRHHFLNDDTFEWDVVIKDDKGKIVFLMDGKSTRVKDEKK